MHSWPLLRGQQVILAAAQCWAGRCLRFAARGGPLQQQARHPQPQRTGQPGATTPAALLSNEAAQNTARQKRNLVLPTAAAANRRHLCKQHR